jgi:hypothetical protein
MSGANAFLIQPPRHQGTKRFRHCALTAFFKENVFHSQLRALRVFVFCLAAKISTTQAQRTPGTRIIIDT